jgi:HTH-type transcriptional regulator/antitoxin HigA
MIELANQRWVFHPGVSILDIVEERGWTPAELAKCLEYSEAHVKLLINGKATLTVDLAHKLEQVLGRTVEFWLSLEAKYRRHLVHTDAECVE